MERFMKYLTVCLLLIVFSIGLVACRPDYYPEYESGYYRYAVKTEKDGMKKAYIIGLTESGQEQTILIYPEELDGIPVYGIGYNRPFAFGSEEVGEFRSRNLQKFYFPNMPKEKQAITVTSINKDLFAIYWGIDNNKFEGGSYNGVFGVEGAIFGFNFYNSYIRKKTIRNNLCRIANVSYIYNYEGTPNGGYYWVDSYDESIITFIPPQPQREGYIFDGWYKEAECINKWDFTTDITGKEIVIEENKVYDTYEGIYLYAKWIEE